MKLSRILLLTILLTGCKSSHKLTGTDYVELSSGETFSQTPDFPAEIIRALGWGDLASDTLKGVREEFRISLTSEVEPYHLFRVYTAKKGVKGESIFFWAKKRALERKNAHEDMKAYLKGKCNEFFETDNYEYCTPNYFPEPDWGKVYSNLEERNIWKIRDQSQLELTALPDTNIWKMSIQVRLEDYYRSYVHTSPEQYSGILERVDILGILSQLQLLANSTHKPENFNVYSGITNGKRNSSFILCDESEVWRFEASLEELISASGYPVTVEEKEDEYFYVTVSASVEDEWYGSRGATGFMRVIRPTEVNNIITLSKKECPSR